MIGQVPQASIQIQPLFAEAVVYDVVLPNAATTTAIAVIAVGHGREVVTMVTCAVNLTIIKRNKAAQRLISVDRTFAHVGGVDSLNQDTGGLGDELEILATNASGAATTATIKVLVRS